MFPVNDRFIGPVNHFAKGHPTDGGGSPSEIWCIGWTVGWQTRCCSTKWTDERFTLTFQTSALSGCNAHTTAMVPVEALLPTKVTLNHESITLWLSARAPKM